MINREEMKKEMLSKVNADAIAAYISKTDSAADYDADVTKMLEAWAENKVDIYVKFGRQLKIEKEVECNIPENQCKKLREDFISEYREPKYILANTFVSSIRLSESSNNYLDRDYFLLGTKFAKGMRVSRCFRQLLPGKEVSDYQTKFSMFIQKFKVHGRAVVSIDPMDYLTMSVNNSGWRSCHIITNGIHKAGCVSYMIDPSTAIAYTTDKVITADRKYPGLSYSNKIWRQCVHIGENFALQARQYPGLNPSNRNAVGALLAEMFNNFYNTDSFKHEEKNQDDIYRYQRDNDGNAYNDIACGSFGDGGGLISSDSESDLSIKININAPAICARCGKHNVRHSDMLVCGRCSEEVNYYNDDCDDDYVEEWED